MDGVAFVSTCGAGSRPLAIWSFGTETIFFSWQRERDR